MSMNAKGQGHLATLTRSQLDCRSFDTSKDILSKTARHISIKFHTQLTDNGGTKVCSNGPDHMTKYGKSLEKSSFPKPLVVLKHGKLH